MSAKSYEQALQDFRRARQEAALRQLLSRFLGRSDQLLAYRDLSDKLNITDTFEHGVQEIPLKAIVGSVGRADDFTRDFLPKRDSDAERWANVKAAVIEMRGWRPIDVYKIGDVYFVKDGNHRVSVARQLGNETISANVTEIETRLSIDADDDPRAIIARANYIDFLEKTKLDQSRPEADLELTFIDQYSTLLAQIDHHRHHCQSDGQEISLPQAAASWYDEVYLPVLKLIRNQGIMRNFQDRTETDMYILLSERREELEEALGWEVKAQPAVSEWASSLSKSHSPFINRLGARLRDALVPNLGDGPPPGEWRKQRDLATTNISLFNDILISLQGTEADWRLLDNTLMVAQREEANLLAIHAVSSRLGLESTETGQIEAEFRRRCRKAGVEGQFAAEVGVEGKLMIQRAPWVDLVSTNLTFATEYSPGGRLSSGVDFLIQRCPRPILVITGEKITHMDKGLLAYDGSPKADEALFVAAYLAARWHMKLTVLTVITEYTEAAVLDDARRYLIANNLLNVKYILEEAPITEAVLKTAKSQGSNLLIMGGFGYRPVRYLVLGSTVNGVLDDGQIPTLICR
ncbi:MAG: universal stress protein [Candidatus Promineifilaceae bacterium]